MSFAGDADIFLGVQVERMSVRFERTCLGEKANGGVQGGFAQFGFGREEDAIQTADKNLDAGGVARDAGKQRAENNEFGVIRHAQAKTARAGPGIELRAFSKGGADL